MNLGRAEKMKGSALKMNENKKPHDGKPMPLQEPCKMPPSPPHGAGKLHDGKMPPPPPHDGRMPPHEGKEPHDGKGLHDGKMPPHK